MFGKLTMLALALAFGLALATPVHAQFEGEDDGFYPYYDPYAAAAAAKQQQAAGYPGEDEQGDPSAKAQDPTPQNPVRRVYENGKVIVLVGSERHFGYRIGDIAPVTILVLADDDVTLNFDLLSKGVLGSDGSDFELAEPALIRVVQKQQGKTLWRIDVKVRSFVPRKAIPFTAEIMYSTEMNADGKTPLWKQLTTPDFVVTTSNTADNGTNLLEGDLSEAPNRLSWFTYPVLLVGLTLLLLWPTLLALRWYRRVRPPRVVPPNEAAWRVFDKVYKEGRTSGFTVKHYKQLASALRRYLGVEPASLEEVIDRLKDHPDLTTVTSALAKCERVLYEKKVLSDVDNVELYAELEKLVPRP